MNIHCAKKSLCLLFILIFAITAIPGLAQDKRSWKVEDSFKTKNIGELQASPDGGALLFVLSRTNLPDNESYSSIWKRSADDGELTSLTADDGSVSSPRWSPDGSRIAYFNRDESGLGLWVMNADGSGKQKLTNLERSNAYINYFRSGSKLSWSPDGSMLAYTAAGPKYYENDINAPFLPTGNESLVIDRMLHKTYYYYSDLRRTHVWTIPAEGGSPRQVSSGDYDYNSISWSPDGQFIACVSNQTGRDDYNANNDIMLLSVEGDEAKQLTFTAGPESDVRWVSEGSILAYRGRIRSNRSKESDAELHKIFTINTDGKNTVNLTGELDRWVGQYQWSADSDKIYFTAQNEGRVELYSVPSRGGDYTPLVDERGHVGSFSVASDGTVYYVYEDVTSPDEIYRVGSDGGSPEQLTSFNQEFVDEVTIVDAEHFLFNSFDGLPIDGWIMKPANYQQGESYPLILNIHGGPHGQDGYVLDGKFQEQAANGYAVMFMNPRGSSGRGQDFSDEVVGDIAGGDYKDIMDGLEYAIGRYDFIDSESMGVTGGSYGGYMTNWVITQTDMFDAAVPVSSISNLITQWAGGNNYLWYESDMESKAFENYELAWARSPMKYVQGATTPTLFIHGRWDNGTTLTQATNMYMALKSMGVESQLVVYPREGHGVRNQPIHTADYHQRALDWFDEYLK
jgi:dipeptidyl aminopeptidase/acylaminoacyl peptidase